MRPRGPEPEPYRIVAHTADTAIEVWGDDREQLIEHAAAGMFALMYGAATGSGERVATFDVAAATDTDLLVDVLSELLFLSETGDTAFSRITVTRVGEHAVSVQAVGGPVAAVGLTGPPVKAVTYHGLEIAHEDLWRATIVFDV